MVWQNSLSFSILLLFGLSLTDAVIKLREKFQWTAIDFAYPDRQSWLHALAVGDFIPENNLPVGIERYKDKLFVTVPRWRPGIPSTLNYVPIDSPDISPRLIPYPDWASNRLGDCENGLTTVYRIKADKCDRLWVLDTGTYGIGNTTKNPCPYALNIFDLKTDKRILRYEFRPEDTNQNTFIANIAVDLGFTCDDAYAYFSDELGYGLIVYSLKENTSWRFEHSYFMPDPLAGDFNIAGLNFQWGEEGIFGMALSPIKQDGFRTMFFSPLASNYEFGVSTAILHNKSRTEDSYHDFFVVGSRGKDGHLTATVMDDNGVMFFNLIDRNAVGCWNSHLPYEPQYLGIADKDDVGLVFPCDVKIDQDDNIWVMSDRMNVFLIANLDYRDVNFRVYTTTVPEILEGTVCAYPKYNSITGAEYRTPQVKGIPYTAPLDVSVQYTSPVKGPRYSSSVAGLSQYSVNPQKFWINANEFSKKPVSYSVVTV